MVGDRVANLKYARRSESLGSERDHTKVEERQGVDHRWSVCGDKRAVGRDTRARSKRLEPRHPVDVEAPGCEGGTLRDSPTPKMFYKGLTFAEWSRSPLCAGGAMYKD